MSETKITKSPNRASNRSIVGSSRLGPGTLAKGQLLQVSHWGKQEAQTRCFGWIGSQED